MRFIEKIRKRLDLTNVEFGRLLGFEKDRERQGYRSLMNSNDRIKLDILITLRKISGLTDKALLDSIEEEINQNQKAKKNIPEQPRR